MAEPQDFIPVCSRCESRGVVRVRLSTIWGEKGQRWIEILPSSKPVRFPGPISHTLCPPCVEEAEEEARSVREGFLPPEEDGDVIDVEVVDYGPLQEKIDRLNKGILDALGEKDLQNGKRFTDLEDSLRDLSSKLRAHSVQLRDLDRTTDELQDAVNDHEDRISELPNGEGFTAVQNRVTMLESKARDLEGRGESTFGERLNRVDERMGDLERAVDLTDRRGRELRDRVAAIAPADNVGIRIGVLRDLMECIRREVER